MAKERIVAFNRPSSITRSLKAIRLFAFAAAASSWSVASDIDDVVVVAGEARGGQGGEIIGPSWRFQQRLTNRTGRSTPSLISAITNISVLASSSRLLFNSPYRWLSLFVTMSCQWLSACDRSAMPCRRQAPHLQACLPMLTDDWSISLAKRYHLPRGCLNGLTLQR